MPIVVAAAILAPAPHPYTPASHCREAASFRHFSSRVWTPNHWRRRSPSPATLAAKRKQLNRARGCGYRGKLRATWKRDKRAFYEHRHYMQELEALTPYGAWAIPEYVVMCESGGDWGAVNPSSGAAGPYQLLPSTYYGVCRSCDWSHLDQHRAARAVWERSGGSEWVCA